MIDPNQDISSQISNYFKSRGVSDQETPYWTQKWGEFGKKDPAYFEKRLSQADVFGGGSGQGSTAPQQDGMMNPLMAALSSLGTFGSRLNIGGGMPRAVQPPNQDILQVLAKMFGGGDMMQHPQVQPPGQYGSDAPLQGIM